MRPLGSAAVTATPANATLSRILVQSSGRKALFVCHVFLQASCYAAVRNETVASGQFYNDVFSSCDRRTGLWIRGDIETATVNSSINATILRTRKVVAPLTAILR